MKKGFLLYKDNYEPIKALSMDERGELLTAMFEYNILERIPELSPAAKMAFLFLKPTFDRDIQKYEHICEKNKVNAHKRWDSNNATACDRMRDDAKHAHIHIDIDKHIHKDIVRKPTLDQIKEYISSNNLTINPDQFFNYYEANGWKVGRNQMKDWRAAVRHWQSKEKKGVSYGKQTSTDRTVEAVNNVLRSIEQEGDSKATR